MDDIKYLAIYLDNSCEVHFSTSQEESNTSKLFLSPCGSEFVYRTYDHLTNTIQSTFKYRTAYPISAHFEKLIRVLRIRNRYCDDRPFISPILEENYGNSSLWTTGESLTEAIWQTDKIELDSKSFSYIWTSKCSRAELKLHMNKSVAYIKYPVRIPRTENDLYSTKQLVSKYIYKYTTNEQEISVLNPPTVWAELIKNAIEMVNKSSKESKEIRVWLPEAMPLSCSSTHLHKFDDIPLSSEPKVIFLDSSWFKIYYKSKSIEIDCPMVMKDGELISEYYVSDSTTGKYFTRYSLNRSKSTLDEIKLSLDNLPSFKTHEKKILNYASILLKRVNSIKFISNFSNCYLNDKMIENEDEIICSTPRSNLDMAKFDLNKINMKREFFIEDTGHFKCFDDQSIIINFIDRVKLVVDEHSIDAFLSGQTNRSFCTVYLPDSSQHELCWGVGREKLDDYFKKYLMFFDQWLDWLIRDGTIQKRV